MATMQYGITSSQCTSGRQLAMCSGYSMSSRTG